MTIPPEFFAATDIWDEITQFLPSPDVDALDRARVVDPVAYAAFVKRKYGSTSPATTYRALEVSARLLEQFYIGFSYLFPYSVSKACIDFVVDAGIAPDLTRILKRVPHHQRTTVVYDVVRVAEPPTAYAAERFDDARLRALRTLCDLRARFPTKVRLESDVSCPAYYNGRRVVAKDPEYLFTDYGHVEDWVIRKISARVTTGYAKYLFHILADFELCCNFCFDAAVLERRTIPVVDLAAAVESLSTVQQLKYVPFRILVTSSK